jgi:hypothetical protein
MNRVVVAKELVKLAKELMAGSFDEAKRHYDSVTPEQLSAVKKLAKKFHGKVSTKPTTHGNFLVKVVFRDNFPESFATRDAESFDKEVKSLGLEKFSGMSELVF